MLHNIRVKEQTTANNQERKGGKGGRGDIAGRKSRGQGESGGNPGNLWRARALVGRWGGKARAGREEEREETTE